MALTASNIAAWTKAISRSAGGPGSADATMATAVASQSAMTLAETDVIGQASVKPSSSFGRVVDIVSSRSIEAARLSARLVGHGDGLEIGELRLGAVTGAQPAQRDRMRPWVVSASNPGQPCAPVLYNRWLVAAPCLHAISRCTSSISKNCMKGASHASGGC